MAFDPDIVIRRAELRDADAIQAMVAGLAKETIGDHQPVLSADAVRRYGFGPEQAFHAFVAICGGDVVAAMIVYDEFSTWRGQKGVYVLDIFIARSARGKGLGKRLIAEAAKWGKARGATYVRLSVDQENIHAINFYEAIGFTEGSHDRVFLLSGEAFEKIDNY